MYIPINSFHILQFLADHRTPDLRRYLTHLPNHPDPPQHRKKDPVLALDTQAPVARGHHGLLLAQARQRINVQWRLVGGGVQTDTNEPVQRPDSPMPDATADSGTVTSTVSGTGTVSGGGGALSHNLLLCIVSCLVDCASEAVQTQACDLLRKLMLADEGVRTTVVPFTVVYSIHSQRLLI